jgi:hypothetical protein
MCRRAARRSRSTRPARPPRQVATVVELARRGRRRHVDAHGRQAQERALDQRPERRERGRGAVAEVERERGALGHAARADRRDHDLERDAVVAGLGQREGGGAHRLGVPGVGRERAARLRVEARRADAQAGDDEERRERDDAGGAQPGAGRREAPGRGDAPEPPDRSEADEHEHGRGRRPPGERRDEARQVGGEQQVDAGRRAHARASDARR